MTQSTPLNRDEVRDKFLDMIREERSIMEIMNLVDLYTQKHSDTALKAFAKEVRDNLPEYDSKPSRNYFQASTDNQKAHKNGYKLAVREQRKSLNNLIDKWTGVEDE